MSNDIHIQQLEICETCNKIIHYTCYLLKISLNISKWYKICSSIDSCDIQFLKKKRPKRSKEAFHDPIVIGPCNLCKPYFVLCHKKDVIKDTITASLR